MSLSRDNRRYLQINLNQDFLRAMRTNGEFAEPNSFIRIIHDAFNQCEEKHRVLKQFTPNDAHEADLGNSGYKFTTNSWSQWFTLQMSRLNHTVYDYITKLPYPNITTFQQRLELEGIRDARLQNNILYAVAPGESFPGYASLFPQVICALVSQYTNAVLFVDELDIKFDLKQVRHNRINIDFTFDLITTNPASVRAPVCGKLLGRVEITPENISILSMHALFDTDVLSTYKLYRLKQFSQQLQKAGSHFIELPKEDEREFSNKKVVVSKFEHLFRFIANVYRHRVKISWSTTAIVSVLCTLLYYFFAATANPTLLLLHPQNLMSLFNFSLATANTIGTILTAIITSLLTKVITSGLIHISYMATRKESFLYPQTPTDVFEFNFHETNVAIPERLPKPQLGNRAIYTKLLRRAFQPKTAPAEQEQVVVAHQTNFNFDLLSAPGPQTERLSAVGHVNDTNLGVPK